MKAQKKTICLNRKGVDEASECIQNWLQEAGIRHTDIVRIRLTMEELLLDVSENGEDDPEAELRFEKWLNDWKLSIRYNGTRFDPTEKKENELQEWTAQLLSRTGFLPIWRWRSQRNELLLRIPGKAGWTKYMMLYFVAAAVVAGLLGRFLPDTVRIGIAEYGLSFLTKGFLDLLNTFIGIMIFLSIVTGICGIGSAAAFERIGKLMVSRFVAITFLICAALVLCVSRLFPLDPGTAGGGSTLYVILEMIFGIIPSNPIEPFLNGNTLQIVFLAAIVGISLLLTGSQTESIRNLFFQAGIVVTRCIAMICILLPLYVFCTLLNQFWSSTAAVFLTLWKPLLFVVVSGLVLMLVYAAAVCRKLKVKASVLIPKLMPDFLIGLTTASTAAAFSLSMEINEKKLGIDPAFSRTAIPIGNILAGGALSLLYVTIGAFVAHYYDMTADISWWISLWFVCSLLSMATPPVAGGVISGLTIIMTQFRITGEGMVICLTLAIIMDFLTTAVRIFILHCEVALQADRLELLDHDILRAV